MIYMQITPNLDLHLSSCLQTKSPNQAHTWNSTLLCQHLPLVLSYLLIEPHPELNSWISSLIPPLSSSSPYPTHCQVHLLALPHLSFSHHNCLSPGHLQLLLDMCLQIPHLAASIAVMITLWAKHILDFPECSWAGSCLLLSLIPTSYPLLHPIQISFSPLPCLILLPLGPLHMLVSLPGTLLTFCMWISSTQLQISI